MIADDIEALEKAQVIAYAYGDAESVFRLQQLIDELQSIGISGGDRSARPAPAG